MKGELTEEQFNNYLDMTFSSDDFVNFVDNLCIINNLPSFDINLLGNDDSPMVVNLSGFSGLDFGRAGYDFGLDWRLC